MMSDIELFDVINKLTVCMPLDELTWGGGGSPSGNMYVRWEL